MDPPQRARSGGRSERVRRQVAAACLELLAEGDVELRPADVAKRSQVSRATIYRWWPTKAALLHEALAEHTGERLDPPDTGSWAGDVHAFVHQLAAFFADPVEVAQNAIMASGRHHDFEVEVLRTYAPLFEGWREVVERARRRGEVDVDADADAIVLTLVSPLLVVPLLFHLALEDEVLDRLAALVIAGAAPAR